MSSSKSSRKPKSKSSKSQRLDAPKITQQEMVIGEKIAEGMFGVVYKGTCRGQQVAIKELKNFNAQMKEEFIAEVEIMAKVVHPHIVLLLGACTEGRWAMVTEFCSRGDLNNILHGKDKDKLTLSKKIHCALHICAGMSWLTGDEVKILHRDLKPANVLVDANWNCKIADFGLSLLKAKGCVSKGEAEGGGSPLWMSPEALLEEEKITEKTDVYSFALVLWEILTQKALFPEYTDLDVFTNDIAKKGVRPMLNNQVPILDDIVKKCWVRDPHQRPSFQQLLPMLQNARIDIILGSALCPQAGVFWKKYWLTLGKVPLELFVQKLNDFLKRPWNPTEYKCLMSLFCPPEMSSSSSHIPQMSLTKFSKLLKWFGPLQPEGSKSTMLDQLVNTMKQPWFFGTINRQAAEAKLDPFKGNEGTYLVRLNSGQNEAIEVSPYTISRIEKGAIVHNRVCPSKKGGFFIKAADTQYRSAGGIADLVVTILVASDAPCKNACGGHPFSAIFSAPVSVKDNYQMARSDEESD